MKHTDRINTKKLTLCALFAAISLTLYIIESMIPTVVPIPGVKIGLAYIPIIFLIFIGGEWKICDAAAVLTVRVFLSALIAGNLVALCFSSVGGLFALITMAIMRTAIKEAWAAIPAGIFSAVMHNVGQLTAASFIYTWSVWAYLPYLLISAVISGLFTGLLIYFLVKKPNKLVNRIKYLR